MGNGAGGMIDILFLVSGVYLVYTAVMAKKKGNVSDNVMLAKGVTEKDIVDKAGFIEYMYKRILLAGVMVILAGIVHMVNDWYLGLPVLTWIGIALILAAMAVYTAAYLQGKKRYLKMHDKDRHKNSK